MKLTKKDRYKINRRYDEMISVWQAYELEELKTLFNTKKMSSTDRAALVKVVSDKLELKRLEESKINKDNIEEE